MSQWGFYFDQSRCLGCKTCVLACKQWNEDKRGDLLINTGKADDYIKAEGELEPGSIYINPDTGANNYELYQDYYMKESWRRIETYETGYVRLSSKNTFEQTIKRNYLSVSCNHCSEPACVAACPVMNIYKDKETGAVLRVSSDGCISCGRCKDACPWDAPQFYDEKFAQYASNDPKRPRMTKCTMCVDRIKEGLKPACVASCWNRALDAGPMDELKVKYSGKYVESIPESSDRKGFPDALRLLPNVIFKKKD